MSFSNFTSSPPIFTFFTSPPSLSFQFLFLSDLASFPVWSLHCFTFLYCFNFPLISSISLPSPCVSILCLIFISFILLCPSLLLFSSWYTEVSHTPGMLLWMLCSPSPSVAEPSSCPVPSSHSFYCQCFCPRIHILKSQPCQQLGLLLINQMCPQQLHKVALIQGREQTPTAAGYCPHGLPGADAVMPKC